MSKLLSQLTPGQSATLSGFSIAASPLRRRLLALGLLPGVQVEMLRRAPLGDPIEIRVRQTQLALRLEEAAALYIEQAAQSGAC